MERGASSAIRTLVNAFRAAMRVDSGAWKAGLREGIMDGVRTRTQGWGPVIVVGLWRWGWAKGRDVRSGRKAWVVRIGVRRRVFRRSLKAVGERVAIGEVGYVVDGTMIRERSVRW